jgi:hypothetical protein
MKFNSFLTPLSVKAGCPGSRILLFRHFQPFIGIAHRRQAGTGCARGEEKFNTLKKGRVQAIGFFAMDKLKIIA